MQIYATLFCALVALVLLVDCINASVIPLDTRAMLVTRKASTSTQNSIWLQSLHDPVGAAKRVLQIKGVGNPDAKPWFKGNLVSPHDQNSKQVPWASDVSFDQPSIPDSTETGFKSVPGTTGNLKLSKDFGLKDRDGNSAKNYYYVNKNYDSNKIKRAVVVWPGYWRESWLYGNYVSNAFKIAKEKLGVSGDEVLIVAPLFLNQHDKDAGGVDDNQIYFKDSGWEVAGISRGPDDFTMSSFKMVDQFVDYLLDKSNFPNMEKVVLTGHSMGAQANLRYAILTKRSTDDPLGFLVANPASFLYVSRDRSESTDDCGNYDEWPNGIGGAATVPAYGRNRVKHHKQELVDNFRSRDVMFAFGLNDNGGSTGNCAKNTQGATRLERAANYVKSLSNMDGGFPSNFKAVFLSRISHQDYPTLAHPVSLKYMFGGSIPHSMLDKVQ